jgi:WD40 repeat protein
MTRQLIAVFALVCVISPGLAQEPVKPVATYQGHVDAAHAVAFSPDGKLLASGSDDKSIKLWEAEGGKEQATLAGHTAAVVSLEFSPDSQALASAASNGKVILWNPAARVALTEWQLTGEVCDIAFTPDGKHLLTANANGTVCVFRIAPK